MEGQQRTKLSDQPKADKNTGKEEQTRNVRASTRKEMTEGGKTKTFERSLARDTGKLWNQAPREIRDAPTQELAKKQIRLYCKTLPI